MSRFNQLQLSLQATKAQREKAGEVLSLHESGNKVFVSAAYRAGLESAIVPDHLRQEFVDLVAKIYGYYNKQHGETAMKLEAVESLLAELEAKGGV